ncbi:AbiH family protein [Collinsella tanakaei]|uniref:AbiH family protein n=1 Tax=Collinsella tanakaei TaxID=626935 RepID=UPI0025A31729|nr:AbiH family protein [Collinsella tanakaei]MDM8302543.1 AbiH family protein [Collinsella tanakaei]
MERDVCMLRITYLVGNGFDLQAKLPTKPHDIIDAYLQTVGKELSSEMLKNGPDSALVQLLSVIQATITNNYELWGDFETALGDKLAEACANAGFGSTQYAWAIEHFTRHLHAYITKINQRIAALKITPELEEQFYRSTISCMQDQMRGNQRTKMQTILAAHVKDNWSIRYINFNYITLLDRVLLAASRSNKFSRSVSVGYSSFERRLNPNALHIHGNIADSHGIITGVDDASQIVVPGYRDDAEVLDTIVKPRLNMERGDLVENETLQLIAQSNIICIYGMAMGKTDATWWKAIAEWLDSGTEERVLAINAWGNNSDISPRDNQRANDAALARFFDGAGVSDNDIKSRLEPRIAISRNSKVFDLDIDLSEDSDPKS